MVKPAAGVVVGLAESQVPFPLLSPTDPNALDPAFAGGRVVGNVGGMVIGIQEMTAGAGGVGLGIGVEVLSGGTATFIVVPEEALSGIVLLHGSYTTFNGGRALWYNVEHFPASGGTGTPPPAGATPAAPGVTLPGKPGQIQHIFRDAAGHLPDTPTNRSLLEGLANDTAAVLGPDRFGNTWAARLNLDGTQTWVQYRNGVIINGGVNPTPRTYNPQTGLSGP